VLDLLKCDSITIKLKYPQNLYYFLVTYYYNYSYL